MTVGTPILAKPQLFGMSDGSAPPEARVNVVLYGNSGVGKTALATALPWGPAWGEKAVYIAWDSGSETLLSVVPEDRKRLVVVTPKPSTGPDGRLSMNPYKTAMEIATADWRRLVPEARTLIWDGGTRLAEQILRAVANSGATVSRKKKEAGDEDRLTFGERGGPDFMAQPIIPDYGMAQHAIMQWSEALRQQPMNVIAICVSDYYKPEGGSMDGDTVGGPATVGAKIIPKFMKDWDNVFRISIESETVMQQEPGKPVSFVTVNKRVLRTEKHGIWDAKIRQPATAVNPLARFELTDQPREFWKKFESVTAGNK